MPHSVLLNGFVDNKICYLEWSGVCIIDYLCNNIVAPLFCMYMKVGVSYYENNRNSLFLRIRGLRLYSDLNERT